jgi:hypothetical protein
MLLVIMVCFKKRSKTRKKSRDDIGFWGRDEVAVKNHKSLNFCSFDH